MEKSKAFSLALTSIVLGGAVLALGGFALASATPHQKPLVCKRTSATTCSLNLSTFPDSLQGVHGKGGGPHPTWVSYSNDNLVVPANTTVDVTIDQYDSGGSLNNSFFSHVYGTVGGTATVDGKVIHSWNTNDVGHTFTLRGIPGNGTPLFVSVPLPADSNTKPVTVGYATYTTPVVVKFSFKTGSKGVYAWNCEFPCGDQREGQFGLAMSTFGYMSGALTVE